MNSFRIAINPQFLEKARNFFNATLEDILLELLQNSRRANATKIAITFDGNRFTLEDNGIGIFSGEQQINLGSSHWNDEIQQSEDPAGCGLFSLARRGCKISSKGHFVSLEETHFSGKEEVNVLSVENLDGTQISFCLSEKEASELKSILSKISEYYPLPVYFQREELPRSNFLEEAVYIRQWEGLKIGVVPNRLITMLNFYGLVVKGDHLHIDNHGRLGTYLTCYIEVLDCPQLQLTLPSRKEVVQDNFYEELQTEIWRTLFIYLKEQSLKGYTHNLSYEQWVYAKSLGVELPEASPELELWIPKKADIDKFIEQPPKYIPVTTDSLDSLLIVDCDLLPPQAHSLANNFSTSYTLIFPEEDYEGYSWYDQIKRITEINTTLWAENQAIPLENSIKQFRPEKITLNLNIHNPVDDTTSQLKIGTDIAFDDADYLEDACIYLSQTSQLDTDSLVELLVNCFFFPSTDWEADSYDSQKDYFLEEALLKAQRIFFDEATVLEKQIQQAIEKHLVWLLPRNETTIVKITGDREISIDFEQNLT